MITVEQIMGWEPCENYDEEKIRGLIGEGKTLPEILDLPIPAEDRLWVVLREDVMPDKIMHEFACRCAESVLPIWEKMYPEDKRPHEAIRIKRLWLQGKATDKDLSDARNAAWEAARDAAWEAARDAARNAARNAAWEAAWNAAWEAARDAQIMILKEMIQGCNE